LAHSLSAKKRVRQSEKRRLRNNSYKTRVKNLEKKINQSISSGNKEESMAKYVEYQKVIDSVSRKGILHEKYAARKKSKLIKRINAL
jgi:small subunit ribosomal protein S20